MALPYPIAASQTDAKSPVDDNLMDSIRLDLDYLDTQVSTANFVFTWNIQGHLVKARGYYRALSTAVAYKAMVPVNVRAVLRKGGITGNLKFDLRKHAPIEIPITSIDYQYSASTSSIANIAPALATQSITRTTTQISTQSITAPKGSVNVSSIIRVPGQNKWRYNLASTPDSDYEVGDTITFSSCTNAANDGSFTIVEVNQGNGANVVVTNASGVAQTSAAGTASLRLYSYNFSNPVSSEFAIGESALFASHTTGANNGTLKIYKLNQAGNNIWVKNATGVAQAGVAGVVDVQRFRYTFSTSPSATDFIVGEAIKAASHTNALNDGNRTITAVSSGSNYIDVYNATGVTQGGVAGTVNTNRWVYALPSDPSTNVTAGNTVRLTGHTTAANNGTFTVKAVDRSGTDNIVIYNTAGVAQGGAVGTTGTTRKLIKFASDQSATFTTDSFIECNGVPDSYYNKADGRAPLEVLQVNRGGGANYNVVVDIPLGAAVASPAGYVLMEMKSLLDNVAELAPDLTGLQPAEWQVFSTTDLVGTSIPADTPVGLYVLEIPDGDPRDLTVIMH